MGPDDSVRISSYEEWRQYEQKRQEWATESHPESVQHMRKGVETREESRQKLLPRFPHSAVLEGYEPYLDFAARWLWSNVSPCDGKCQCRHSEWPACPLVLATKTVREYTYKDKDGQEQKGKEPQYADPGDHNHEGKWTCLSLTKSGYDCFYMDYLFESEQDRDRFIANLPAYRGDDNFDDEE